jgi:hypothetical protein
MNQTSMTPAGAAKRLGTSFVAMLSIGAALVIASPAAATSTVDVVDGKCISVANAAGCKFTGNIGPAAFNLEAQTSYNLYNNTHATANPDITLNFLAATDDSFAGFGQTSGTWETPGFLVDFLAVKAGNFFILYQLAAPASSGSWTTAGLTNKHGTLQGLSHLTFFGTADDGGGGSGSDVPEPASWMTMILGMGLVGVGMRRRSARVSVTA